MTVERIIAVVCKDRKEYKEYVEKHLIPILEGYHNIKFIKNHADDSYQVPGRFRVIHVATAVRLQGLRNYQLVKCGRFFEHPDLDLIEEHYQMELKRRGVK